MHSYQPYLYLLSINNQYHLLIRIIIGSLLDYHGPWCSSAQRTSPYDPPNAKQRHEAGGDFKACWPRRFLDFASAIHHQWWDWRKEWQEVTRVRALEGSCARATPYASFSVFFQSKMLFFCWAYLPWKSNVIKCLNEQSINRHRDLNQELSGIYLQSVHRTSSYSILRKWHPQTVSRA